MAIAQQSKWHSKREHLQCRNGEGIGVQVVWISAQFRVLMRDGKGIDAQRCRGALGRASLLIVNGSLRSIDSSELPSMVAV